MVDIGNSASSVTAARVLDDAALLKFTGQTTVRTVNDAKQIHVASEAQLADARRQLRRTQLAVVGAAIRVMVSRVGAPPILVGVIAGAAVAIVLGVLDVALGLPLGLILFLSFGALITTGILFALVGQDRAGETDENRHPGRLQEFASARMALSAARRRFNASSLEVPRTAQLLAAMQAAATYRLNVTESDEVRRLAAMARSALQERLIGVDRSLLSGPEFERHLQAIFEVLGYLVEYRGRTGDQGVDLVLSTGGDRIAVQAKCHTGSVGNDAVQQALSGKAFHDCQRCAVITNSTFTPSARDLARKVECALIDGQKLPDLIRGIVRL